MNCRGCIFFTVLGFALASWTQTTKPTARQEAEYYVFAYAQHYRVPAPLVRAVVERDRIGGRVPFLPRAQPA
jgi:hypothetical protein